DDAQGEQAARLELACPKDGADERHGDERSQSAREHGDAGLHGRVSQKSLEHERDEPDAAVEDEAQHAHEKDAGRVGANFEDSKVDDGVVDGELAQDEGDQSSDGADGQDDDEARGEPVFFLSFVEHDLQAADAEGEQADAPVVDGAGAALDVRRIEDKDRSKKDRQDANRHVDVEDPAPAVAVSKPAAEDGAEHGSDDDAESPEAHGFAAV